MRAAWPAGEVTDVAAAEAVAPNGPKLVPPPTAAEVAGQARRSGLPAHLAHVATPSRSHHGRGHGRQGDAFHLGGSKQSNADRRQQSDRQDCVIEEICRRQGIDEAWNALEDLQKKGETTDKYVVSRMLMKTMTDRGHHGGRHANTQRVYRCISIVEKFIDSQPTDVDEVLFNALLDTCCRLKDMSRLEQIVKRMRELKVTPSPVTLGILVKTYGQAGDLEKVLKVWDEMEKQRGQANAVTYGCMIDACVKCGHLPKALEIFQGMRREGKHKNTILYTTLIKGFGLEKDLKSAMDLFLEMPVQGVPYNTITYNSIIDACVKCSDLATAEHLLREMTSMENGLEPDLITFSTILKGYCYLGDLDKALQISEAIKARGLKCDELVYNTLLDGCVKANDTSVGIGLFEEMITSGMRPSTITQSILVRLYKQLGTDEEAEEAINQLYEFYGVEKPVAGDRHGRNNFNRGGSKMSAAYRSPAHRYHHRDDSSWWGQMGDMSGGWHHGMQDMSAPPTPLGSPMGSQYGMSAPPTPMGSPSQMGSPMGTPYGGGCAAFPSDLSGMPAMPGLPCAPVAGGMVGPRVGPPGPHGMSPHGAGSPHGMTMPQYSRPQMPQWSMPVGMPGPDGMTSPMSTVAMPAGGMVSAPVVGMGSPMGGDGSMPLLSSAPPPMATMPPAAGETQGIMMTPAPMTGPAPGTQAYFEAWNPGPA